MTTSVNARRDASIFPVMRPVHPTGHQLLNSVFINIFVLQNYFSRGVDSILHVTLRRGQTHPDMGDFPVYVLFLALPLCVVGLCGRCRISFQRKVKQIQHNSPIKEISNIARLRTIA